MHERVEYFSNRLEAQWKISLEWSRFEIDINVDTDFHDIWKYLLANTEYNVGVLPSSIGGDNEFEIYFESEIECDKFKLTAKLSEWQQPPEEEEEYVTSTYMGQSSVNIGTLHATGYDPSWAGTVLTTTDDSNIVWTNSSTISNIPSVLDQINEAEVRQAIRKIFEENEEE